MKNVIIFLSALAVFLASAVYPIEAKKILFIASNLNDMSDQEKHDARNNLWEYAPPYHVFYSHGYEVDFASPRGGSVPFMVDALGNSSYTINYEGFLERANGSLRPYQI
ncbi:hypothetical protein [Teredinibacter haidensis]|uniref:hypothetical protein n=1 Tax=Teredinibacter haidensis TaxID=2731755 RepID=UPI000A83FFFF|nr:hypothetical protein [Teredinibacter haidensis]